MIKQAIKALFPPGKWVGGTKFSKNIEELEEAVESIIKKINHEFSSDFSQPTKVNAKWAKLLDVSQTDIEQTLRQEKGASLSYFSQFLTDGMKIEELGLFKAKIKNIEVDDFKAGDAIEESKTNPIIDFLDSIKPAYVSFEYYDMEERRIS